MVAGIAGRLGPLPLAVHGIFMSTAGLFYLTANAIALATSTIAGNHLGDVRKLEHVRFSFFKFCYYYYEQHYHQNCSIHKLG